MAESEQIDFYDELRRVRNADPFQPFEIVMTSGARYKVTNPESVASGPGMFCVFPPKQGMHFFPLHQISSIEVIETKTRKKRTSR
ncbi:MAG: hypothetical protein WBD40_11845 [Tepidisphaeraceae bacterium]